MAHRSISAVLIVKDEEDVLDACLQAVRPFVDEVVVYDTGSSDATPVIARASADVVVDGYWDDDFAAARNRALAHAGGDWVFSVDADEVVGGSPADLRSVVDATRADGLTVEVVSRPWPGAPSGTVSVGLRLFRREGVSWSGRLHEVPTHPGSGPVQPAAVAAPVTIEHSGYQTASFVAKDKHHRNVTIAAAAVDAMTPSDPDYVGALTSLGRALTASGDFPRALEVLEAVPGLSPSREVAVMAARVAAVAALKRGDESAAATWIDRLEVSGEAAGRVSLLRGELALACGRADEAVEWADRVVPSRDVWGIPFDVSAADVLRLQAVRGGAQVDGALGLLERLCRSSTAVVFVSDVVDLAHVQPAALGVAARAVDDAFVSASLREAMALEPQDADGWFEALFSAGRDASRVAVAAGVVARTLPLERILLWSLRLREAGLVEHCPLRWVAINPDVPVDRRLSALAVLAGPLGEAAAQRDLELRAPGLDAHQRSTVLSLAPELAGVLRTTGAR